jgi:hypothetical protein
MTCQPAIPRFFAVSSVAATVAGHSSQGKNTSESGPAVMRWQRMTQSFSVHPDGNSIGVRLYHEKSSRVAA